MAFFVFNMVMSAATLVCGDVIMVKRWKMADAHEVQVIVMWLVQNLTGMASGNSAMTTGSG